MHYKIVRWIRDTIIACHHTCHRKLAPASPPSPLIFQPTTHTFYTVTIPSPLATTAATFGCSSITITTITITLTTNTATAYEYPLPLPLPPPTPQTLLTLPTITIPPVKFSSCTSDINSTILDNHPDQFYFTANIKDHSYHYQPYIHALSPPAMPPSPSHLPRQWYHLSTISTSSTMTIIQRTATGTLPSQQMDSSFFNLIPPSLLSKLA